MSVRQLLENYHPFVFTGNKLMIFASLLMNRRQSDIEPLAL